MGGAVYAALDGEAHFAAMPERLETALRGSVSDRATAGPRKSDKLAHVTETSTARHIIRASITSHVGEREIIRVRPFVRVAANLSLATSELTANLPAFNPALILAETGKGGSNAEDAGAEPSGEISIVTRDLAAILPRTKLAGTVPLDDVMGRVREAALIVGTGQRPTLASSAQDGLRLAYVTEGNVDPYAGFETRIVPENITLLPKTSPPANGAATNNNEKIIVVKKGDSVSSILRDLNATADEQKAIAAAFGPRGRDGGLKEGQKLRILMAPSAPGQRAQPFRVVVMTDNTVEAAIAFSDAGKYVAIDVQHTDTESTETEDEDDGVSGVRLYQSVYETALRNQIPRPIINEIIRIYSYDVDFQRRVQPGDSFEVFYPAEEETGENKSEVMFAALTVAGEARKYYRYVTTDDHTVDYYDETGKSAKKFLVRKPLGDGTMRSGFGTRKHPILGYIKMHTGVDWAAPRGTPIYASGGGSVDKAGWESGYGKYVKIRHANGYETAYGHMSAFARGIQPGVRVRQGQIIGYVGSTGLSTGPHLHYEILVNNRFVDPMRIRLPRGRVLEGPVLASFERERDRIDTMMNRAPARVAETTPPRRR